MVTKRATQIHVSQVTKDIPVAAPSVSFNSFDKSNLVVEKPEITSNELTSDTSPIGITPAKFDPSSDWTKIRIDIPYQLRGNAEPRARGVQKLVSHNNKIWPEFVRRMEQYTSELKNLTIDENLGNIQEVGKIYTEYRDQFTNSVNGSKRYYLVVFYSALVCL